MAGQRAEIAARAAAEYLQLAGLDAVRPDGFAGGRRIVDRAHQGHGLARFAALDEEGFEIVTLEEAQKDPAYDYDPDVAAPRGGTLVELAMEAKGTPWPPNAPTKPRERLISICS